MSEQDSRQLYLAVVSALDAEMPNGALNILYVVLAASEREAVRAIQGEADRSAGSSCRPVTTCRWRR
jgi:hypothetical protein